MTYNFVIQLGNCNKNEGFDILSWYSEKKGLKIL